ncbi:MAG: hypothetical protein V3T77_08300, partial [Planctomycetota bacterium]
CLCQVTKFAHGQICDPVEVLSERGAIPESVARTPRQTKSRNQAVGISVLCFGVLEEEKAGCLFFFLKSGGAL